MHVGLFYPDNLPESFRVVADNICEQLQGLQVQVTRFAQAATPPTDVDVLWDPRAGGGNPPVAALCGLSTPLVVTLHGVAPMAIPLWQYYQTLRERYWGWRSNRRKKRSWAALKGQYAAVVTVSESSRDSILQALPIHPEDISWCHNAVDHSLFKPNAAVPESDYFLHISNDEQRKNVDLICDAYLSLPSGSRPRLILKLPAGSGRHSEDGIEVIDQRLDDETLLALYHGAIGFVFPSLFEGFGLPIAEAMASGCPVITADTHACAEVAADAAITVDANSVSAVCNAMRALYDNVELRGRLRSAGLIRAQDFQWRTAAEHYLEVFTRVAQ